MTLLLNAPKTSQSRYRIINADVLDFARDYRGPKFHALIADSPYHLDSIVKRYGKPGSAWVKQKQGADGAFARASRGFMNLSWDGGEISFHPETWAAFSDIMLDGAFGMAFASTRGYHRMVCAIEDAGFVIHPMLCWVQGSSFPKATRIDHPDFAGHRYGRQAIKPAMEPIAVFQKPYRGRPIDSIISSGAGAFNIDAGRIEGPAWSRSTPWKNDMRGGNYVTSTETYKVPPQAMSEGGRWPANFALVHSIGCEPDRCAPDCPIAHLDDQAGERSSGGDIVNAPSRPTKNVYNNLGREQWSGYEDAGSAARFFHNADWSLEVAEHIEIADPFLYMPKVSAAERNRGLDSLGQQTVGDGRTKAIDNAYQRGKTLRTNPHPTLKPIGLTRWLASLLLPPAAYGPRRLFVPFCGTASEMIGAYLAGWDVIYGAEMSTDYCNIGRLRLDYYADPLRQMRMASQPMVASIKEV